MFVGVQVFMGGWIYPYAVASFCLVDLLPFTDDEISSLLLSPFKIKPTTPSVLKPPPCCLLPLLAVSLAMLLRE